MSKRILILLLIISLVMITFCTKKSTSPEEQLLPPTNLTISLVENNKIQINWVGNSTNETAYFIDRKMGTYNWLENFGEVASNITSFTDNIPTNSDTVFSYRIRAFDDANYSAYSDTIAWFSTNSAPSGLQLEQIAQDSLKLTWKDNSIGEEYFRIDRKIDEKGWQMNYAHVPADTTHFLDYTTALYDTCNYKVFAVTGISHSDSTENAFIPFLPAPSNLDLQPLGATEVTLTWQDNCHNEDGYRVFFKRGEIALWDSLNLPVNTEEHSDENVIPGIMNYYKICAYYENDTSGLIEDEINTLPAPGNLTCTQQNVHTFELTWTDDSQFEQGFKIDRKIDEEEWINEIAITEPNATTWIDSTIGRNYNTVYYRLYAYYETFSSDSIETNSNITFPAPSNLAYEKITIYSIKLTWNDNSQGEAGFKIDKKVGANDWQNDYATVSENIQEWTDENAEINENLMYKVYAYCGNNVSDYATTHEIDNTIPAPTNVEYEILSPSSVQLIWVDNIIGEQGFKIDKKVEEEPWIDNYGIVEENITSWIDSNFIQNINIKYRLYTYFHEHISSYKYIYTLGYDLYFSEYIEGTSMNKALEIYNTSGVTANLSNYRIAMSANGNGWQYWHEFPAGSTLANGDVWVIATDEADVQLQAVADEILSYYSVVHHNGNDARGLEKTTDGGTTWTLIDIIGNPDENPGDGWDVAGIPSATKDHTLVRKSSVIEGATDWTTSAGTTAEDSQWIVYPVDTFEYIGFR